MKTMMLVSALALFASPSVFASEHKADSSKQAITQKCDCCDHCDDCKDCKDCDDCCEDC